MKILTFILATTIALGSSAMAQNNDEARARAERDEGERGERGDSDSDEAERDEAERDEGERDEGERGEGERGEGERGERGDSDSDEAEITFEQTTEGDNTVLIDDVRLVKGKGVEVELPNPEETVESIPLAFGQGPDASLTLSWSADQTGWVVEYAENVAGPWKNADAESTVENGRLVIKVTPAKTGSRFYRLVNP